MSAGGPVAQLPVTSVADAIARMEAIGASLPAGDGLGCFNRMYLEVTQQVDSSLRAGFFADPAFMTELDVTFANLYFEAVNAADDPAAGPLAWRPLSATRPARDRADPVRAGWHERPHQPRPAPRGDQHLHRLATSPSAGAHQADYQKVDQLLDAAEQSVRQSFESAPELAVDRHLQAVNNLVASWSINSARDLAWNNSLLLWEVRTDPIARGLLCDSLAAATAAASRMLLIAV